MLAPTQLPTIPYILRALLIANGTHDYYPVLDSKGHIRPALLVREMSEDNTTLSRVDIMATMDLEGRKTIKYLAAGHIVTTPLGTFKPVAKGRVGLDLATGQESGELSLEISFTPSPELLQALTEAAFERRVNGPADRPAPRFVVDNTTKTYNEWFTVGGTGYVKGDNLRFDVDDPRQGVFLVEFETEGVEYRAELSDTPTSGWVPIIFPSGPTAGKTYALEVRALRTQTNGRTVLRSEALPYPIRVHEG